MVALRNVEVGMTRARPRRKEDAPRVTEHSGGGGEGGCSCCRKRRRLREGEGVPPPTVPAAVLFPAEQEVDMADGGKERLFEMIYAGWGQKGGRGRPSLNSTLTFNRGEYTQ